MILIIVVAVVALLALLAILRAPTDLGRPRSGRRRAKARPTKGHGFQRAKPEWVKKEVLRLKALMPDGARKVAETFNFLHAHHGQTVGKTYVAELVKKHQQEILRLRQQLKHRKPRKVQKNLIWALDFTFLPGPQGPRPIFGLVDHGTRLCLSLTALRDRSAIGILRCLLDALDRFGKPAILRTDNEPIFTSRLFRLGLWLLNIRHQRTAPHCPWQNGRIERLFGTVKGRILPWFEEAGVPDDLDEDLATVRVWYNHLRPHQHLDGRTPAMAWNGKKPFGRGKPRYLSVWNGRLTGFVFPT